MEPTQEESIYNTGWYTKYLRKSTLYEYYVCGLITSKGNVIFVPLDILRGFVLFGGYKPTPGGVKMMTNFKQKQARLAKARKDDEEWDEYVQKANDPLLEPVMAEEVQTFIKNHGISLREFRRALPGCGLSMRAIRGIMKLPPATVLTTSRIRKDSLTYAEKQGLRLLREYLERLQQRH